jgi:hypothetical protein
MHSNRRRCVRYLRAGDGMGDEGRCSSWRIRCQRSQETRACALCNYKIFKYGVGMVGSHGTTGDEAEAHRSSDFDFLVSVMRDKKRMFNSAVRENCARQRKKSPDFLTWNTNIKKTGQKSKRPKVRRSWRPSGTVLAIIFRTGNCSSSRCCG